MIEVRTRRTIGGTARGLALALGFAFAGAMPASGEAHRVEVVGTYPIRESMRAKVNPRDEAIQKALWEGVSRVALELIGEEGGVDGEGDAGEDELEAGIEPPLESRAPGGSAARGGTEEAGAEAPDATARFRKIFGRQILPYTRSFRIVEDRGERPVLFADEPGVRSEYLVVVEVIVDVDRVTAELARAGLIETSGVGATANQSITLELIGLERYAGLARVLDALRREAGVVRVETLEFAPSRQLVRVEGPLGPEALAARLRRVESAELVLEPVVVDREGRRLRVMAQWFPPIPVDEADPGVPAPAASAPIPR